MSRRTTVRKKEDALCELLLAEHIGNVGQLLVIFLERSRSIVGGSAMMGSIVHLCHLSRHDPVQIAAVSTA